MAADIEKEFGIKADLVPGSGGVYKITADDKVMYSKKDSDDQFPAEGVVVEALKEHQSA